jgi:hypothetical protein
MEHWGIGTHLMSWMTFLDDGSSFTTAKYGPDRRICGYIGSANVGHVV